LHKQNGAPWAQRPQGTQQAQQALTDRVKNTEQGPRRPIKTVRENIYGQGYGEKRQDDDINTVYNTPYQCVIPTCRYTDIYNRKFHKKVGVSNIVERQRYTTVNKLTPVSKKKTGDENMIVIEDGPKEAQPKKQKTKTTPVVQLFAGNCSSLSEKMREYIIKQHKNYSIWNLVETHERNSKSTFFQNLGYKSCINPAKITLDLGSHGGEIVAYKQHMNVTYIEQMVWDISRDISPADIRSAATIVNIGCAQFINGTAYLSVGEEFSSNNIAIIQQLAMLLNILNLPLLAFGDYNIDSYDMEISGLLKPHTKATWRPFSQVWKQKNRLYNILHMP